MFAPGQFSGQGADLEGMGLEILLKRGDSRVSLSQFDLGAFDFTAQEQGPPTGDAGKGSEDENQGNTGDRGQGELPPGQR